MMGDGNKRDFHVERSVEWNLVHVIYYNIETLSPQRAEVTERNEEIESFVAAAADDSHSIERLFAERTLEAATEERYLVAKRCDAAECLAQMRFGAAGKRIRPVLPVDHQDF